MTKTVTEDKLIYMPFENVLSANGIVQVYRDRYWFTHKERGLVFYAPDIKHKYYERAYPQCNSNESVAKTVYNGIFTKSLNLDDYEIKFIDLVLVPVNVHDYTS